MRIVVVTLFPEFVEHALSSACWDGRSNAACSRSRRSIRGNLPRTCTRRWTTGPYGGGPGMVLKAEPLRLAMLEPRRRVPAARRVYLAADGVPLTQRKVAEFAGWRNWCWSRDATKAWTSGSSRQCIDESVSVGDVVLSGGELPALVVVDAVARLLPGTLGDAESAVQESFYGRAARLAALHATGGVGGARGASGAHRRQPRRDRALAAQAVAGAHVAAAARTCWQARVLSREERKLLDEYQAEHGCDATRVGTQPLREGEK